ncbi:MAG: hypothetical protein PHH16_04925 [Candidatus Gracilibacteria bacterium]|nr:hypothetical protein [Candidatus Gracilibacteria bacterium]
MYKNGGDDGNQFSFFKGKFHLTLEVPLKALLIELQAEHTFDQ